jgi:hypothetical protein
VFCPALTQSYHVDTCVNAGNAVPFMIAVIVPLTGIAVIVVNVVMVPVLV